jgi:hypothetical protein
VGARLIALDVNYMSPYCELFHRLRNFITEFICAQHDQLIPKMVWSMAREEEQQLPDTRHGRLRPP